MSGSDTGSRDDPPRAASWKPDGLRILADRMLRIQGYTAPERVRRPVRRAAEQTAAIVERLADPEVRFRRVAVTGCGDGSLRLEGGVTLHCAAFPRYLGDCREVIVFALTAGSPIDTELTRLNDGEHLLEMLFIETAGWLAVEEITKAFVAHIRSMASGEGLKLTRRMGPGYSYPTRPGEAHWPLEEQRLLFTLLDDGTLPITVLESSAMLPKMSRSGLVGLAPDAVR